MTKRLPAKSADESDDLFNRMLTMYEVVKVLFRRQANEFRHNPHRAQKEKEERDDLLLAFEEAALGPALPHFDYPEPAPV